jgi:hypothetical protein
MQTPDILHSLVQLAPYAVGIVAIAFVWWPGRRHERSEDDVAEQRKQTALLERISAKLEQSH